ncbi:hypothetical protein OAH87_04030 [Marinomonas sp.]|nr:hypothetical protein [Marinomonas sp.]MDB4837616.1 hypothetical protein [Marinomonas sp.]
MLSNTTKFLIILTTFFTLQAQAETSNAVISALEAKIHNYDTQIKKLEDKGLDNLTDDEWFKLDELTDKALAAQSEINKEQEKTLAALAENKTRQEKELAAQREIIAAENAKQAKMRESQNIKIKELEKIFSSETN